MARPAAMHSRHDETKIMIIPVTPFQQNCSLVWDEETNIGAVIDPGRATSMSSSMQSPRRGSGREDLS